MCLHEHNFAQGCARNYDPHLTPDSYNRGLIYQQTGEPPQYILIFKAVVYIATAASGLIGIDDTVTNYLIGDQVVCFYNTGILETEGTDPCLPK